MDVFANFDFSQLAHAIVSLEDIRGNLRVVSTVTFSHDIFDNLDLLDSQIRHIMVKVATESKKD